VPLPWWRRVGRRRSVPLAAGTRPVRRARRGRRAIRSAALLVAVAVLAGAGWLSRSALQSAASSVLDRVVRVEAVAPSAEPTATNSLPDRPAALLVDGTSDRSWSPGPPDAAVGQSVDMVFSDAFRLVYVLVSSGASSEQEAFLQEARPEAIDIVLTHADGSTRARSYRLADEAGAQRLTVGADDVVAVSLTIGSVYRAPDPAAPVALAEVEFRGRR
jgi:hypothetical protein